MNAESPAGSKEVKGRAFAVEVDPRAKPGAPAAGAAGKQPSEGRLACLDAFRGFDILVMIFVNYIAGMATRNTR